MFEILKKLITGVPHSHAGDIKKEISSSMDLAVCIVLLEVAKSDDEFADEERKFIIDVLKKDFNMSKSEAEELIEIGEKILEDDTNKWRYKKIINENFSSNEKQKFIEDIWRLIYKDNRLDKYENQMAHSLSGIFHISHRVLIDAKLKVMEEE